MKRILVTGGSGFIGSHLTEALLAQGHHVTVVDDLSTGQRDNLQHLQSAQQSDQLQIIEDSVGDPAVVDRLTGEADVVYHLAAAVGRRADRQEAD